MAARRRMADTVFPEIMQICQDLGMYDTEKALKHVIRVAKREAP